jgi:hypothetical protein
VNHAQALETAKLLIAHGASCDPTTCRPLFGAISKRNYGLVKLLRGHNVEINGTSETPSALQVAVSINDPILCRIILGWGALVVDWQFV